MIRTWEDEVRDFIKKVDGTEFWNVAKPEEWRWACECLYLDYDAYDDPSILYNDIVTSFSNIVAYCDNLQ